MTRTASPTAIETVRSVTQVARVAVKLGEDYHTFEISVTLPPDASDAEIAQAVATGRRISTMQRAELDAQISTLRGMVLELPPMPPTSKQLRYIGQLHGAHSLATIAAVYAELEIDGPEPQTAAQASALIDRFKAISNSIAPDPAAAPRVVSATIAIEDLPF